MLLIYSSCLLYLCPSKLSVVQNDGFPIHWAHKCENDASQHSRLEVLTRRNWTKTSIDCCKPLWNTICVKRRFFFFLNLPCCLWTIKMQLSKMNPILTLPDLLQTINRLCLLLVFFFFPFLLHEKWLYVSFLQFYWMHINVNSLFLFFDMSQNRALLMSTLQLLPIMVKTQVGVWWDEQRLRTF